VSRAGGTGELLAFLAPVAFGQPAIYTGVPQDTDADVTVTSYTNRGDVHGVAVAKLPGLDDHLFTLYTVDDERPYLTAVRRRNAPELAPTSGDGFPLDPLKSAAEMARRPTSQCVHSTGRPELISLSPGVIGASYCEAAADSFQRRLLPIDFQGQPVGPALVTGPQAELSRCEPLTGAPGCPPATIVAHGSRFLRSYVKEGRVFVDELRCRER
jgi:hypothetical protein